ncbi:MAG: TonB-dependent receptor [Bacteroidota bacterium]
MCKLLFTTILLSFLMTSHAQSVLKGTVTDEKGNAVTDANIVLVGTSQGVSTNAEGNYEFTDLNPTTYFVEISHVTFSSQTRAIILQEGDNRLDFILSQTSNQLDEVVISGSNSRLENLQVTAASVSVVNTKEIAQLQLNKLSDMNGIAPNFRTFDDGANGGFTLISSRGISTADNFPAVGVYIDNIPFFNGFSFPITLQDIDNIEILRGPQGTLYGRNSLAGVIKITTKEPTNNIDGYLRIDYGNLDRRELNFAFNAPLVKDKLFLRASTNILDRDGFVTNLFNNNSLQNRKVIDGNFKLKYFASEKLRFNLLYNVQRKESDAYAYVISNPQISLQDLLENPYEVNFDVDVLRETVNQNMAFSLKYDFKGFQLNAITAYQNTSEQGTDDFDYTPFDIQSAVDEITVSNFSQEFRLVSTKESRLKWLGGVFLYHNSFENIRDLTNGVDIGFINPQFEPLAPFTEKISADDGQKGIAVYGKLTYNITDNLELIGGLRYDYEESSADVDRSFDIPQLPDNSFEQTTDFTAFSPKLSLGYTLNDDVFLFASFARGFRPGGINEFAAPEVAVFDNETSSNYEFGVKTNLLENRLKLNLTGFYTSYNDQQILTLIDLSTFLLGAENIGESRIFGAELEAEAYLAKGLNLRLNLGYLNAEVQEYDEIVINPDFSTTTVDRSGNKLPVSPEINGNITLNYVQPLSKRISFETSWDYNYQDDIFFDIPNQMLQEAYGLLNARAGITTKNMDVFVWTKNLTDEAYFSYGFGNTGFQASTFALPRTYGANLTLKF